MFGERHPNDKDLEKIEIGEHTFFLSPKKGWFYAENAKAPSLYYNIEDAERAYDRVKKSFPLMPLEIYVRSRKTRDRYRVKATISPELLHSMRGQRKGKIFGF